MRQLALPPLPVCAKCPQGQTPTQEKSVDVHDDAEEGNHVMLSQRAIITSFGLIKKHFGVATQDPVVMSKHYNTEY